MPVTSILKLLGDDDTARLQRLLTDPMEAVVDTAFRKAAAKAEFPGDAAAARELHRIEAARHEAPRRKHARHPATLSADEERRLFLHYNYCRYRMMRIVHAHAGRKLGLRATRCLLAWHDTALAIRDIITEANLGLVPSMLERTRIHGVDFGDLISEGQMALLRSIDKFDVSRGFKFSTYACRAILTAMTRGVARMLMLKKRFPAEYDPKLQESDQIDRVRSEVDGACISAISDIWASNGAELSRVERRILAERFGFARRSKSDEAPLKTLSEIADLFGLTKERIRQIQKQALLKLRQSLERRVFAA